MTAIFYGYVKRILLAMAMMSSLLAHAAAQEENGDAAVLGKMIKECTGLSTEDCIVRFFKDTHQAAMIRGKGVFMTYCVLCHGVTGEGNGRAAKIHNPKPANFTKSVLPLEYFRMIVPRGGEAMGRSKAMPAWGDQLTDEQINDVTTYEFSLRKPKPLALTTGVAFASDKVVLKAGDTSLAGWILPLPPSPKDNVPNAARVDLGRHLFFDPRLSGEGNMSCATCHNPGLGWSDGLTTSKGIQSLVLSRASPSIVNIVFNTIMMWDGRKKHLEDQAMSPIESNVEMNMNIGTLFQWLNSNPGYKRLFEAAYPGEGINASTLSKAMASFQRTVIMTDSPFDKWLVGDKTAMTEQQVRGFDIFIDPAKGNCAVCHSAPNFTDSGFRNIGLAAFGADNPDMGRYVQKPVARMKGAFKTPQMRGIALTAPYFHDGSAKTLMDVVEHYNKGGVVTTNLDAEIKPLNLSAQDKQDLVEFMNALTGTTPAMTIPTLPK